MRKQFVMLAVIGAIVFSAQAQTLPKPSPTSEVEQEIGVAKVSLEYSRPGVKGRKIFGGLVPFGELWRFGANSSTKITTDESLYFGSNELKAGTYSVFAIPNKDTWEIIFNTDSKSGTADYTKDKDAFRVKAAVKENSFTETFTLGFDNIKNDAASLVVLWENVRVEVPFTLKTDESAKRNIAEAIKKGENLDKVYSSAANYYFSNKDNKTALEYVEQSLKLKESYNALFLKARILKEQGNDKDALALANTALKLAEKENAKGFADFISGTLKQWSK